MKAALITAALVVILLAPAAVLLEKAERRWLDGGYGVATAARTQNLGPRPYLVVTTHAATSRGSWTVHVLGSLASSEASISGPRTGLQLGLLALVLVMGSMSWLLNNRLLRPVEVLRAETAEIVRNRRGRRLEGKLAAGDNARLAGTMNELLDRLDASAVRQRRFVADASHELRSPLAAVEPRLPALLDAGLHDPAGSPAPA